MLYYLIYFSKAVKRMPESDLLALLEQAREWNEAHDITGMLLYLEGRFLTQLEGRFMQVLEGTEEEIKYIYSKIEVDSRHHQLIILEQGYLKHRYFQNWTMGFKSMDVEEYRKIPGFFELDDDTFSNNGFRSSSTALSFLKSFYETNKNYDYL
jgi:hypothetical protein